MSDDPARFSEDSGLTSSEGVRIIRCDSRDCPEPAVLRVDFHLLCLSHLVSHCHERIEACQNQLCQEISGAGGRGAGGCFVEECSPKIAALLVAQTQKLENIARAQLLDILLWSAELEVRNKCHARKGRAAGV